MTDDDAKNRLCELIGPVPRETWEALECLAAMIRKEATRQNLVSASTIDHLWHRHILDSAQLMKWALPGSWVDLGSGAGFPGLVVAALRHDPVTLVEQRRLRIAFLEQAAAAMGVAPRVTIMGQRAETARGRYAVISARAFAPLDRLLTTALHLSHPDTVWVLPKGRNAFAEVEAARVSWQGDFRVEPSVTDPESGVVIAQGVRPR